jgi:signal transduction histidine kinase
MIGRTDAHCNRSYCLFGARMRWSLRNQILVPLIGIQAVAVAAATMATATLAARRSERELVSRLGGVVDALGHGNFPYTHSVLTGMRGLSGAHFIAVATGKMTESTLGSQPDLALPLRDLVPTTHIDALDQSRMVMLDGARYFAALVRSPNARPETALLVLYPETSLQQVRREAALPPLLLGLGSLGLMILVTSWIAHRISSRMRGIERGVARIAAGDFQPLGAGRRQDEVDDLATSINQMCHQLNNLRLTIQQSERARLLAQLAAGLAHQLRNSITGAGMSIQLHAKRCPGAAGDETLSVALRQLAMTEDQLKRLLSAGRLERRSPETCNVIQLLDEVAMFVEPICHHAKVTLHRPVEHAEGRLGAFAERSSLRAAVLNLTLNAIEAAGQGGEVGLEAREYGDLVALEVFDTGPGPPTDLADSLCEPFVTNKAEGVGLGLALARQVATDSGGRLSWLRTGKQTRFSLTIPRAEHRLRKADEPHPDR